MNWSGDYFDGESAVRHEAAIHVAEEGLSLEVSGGRLVFWPWSEVRAAAGLRPGDPVRLERGDRETPEVLAVSDPAFLDAIERTAPQLRSRIVSPAHRRGLVLQLLPAAAGAAAFIAVIYLWGIPALANTMANRVPVSWEEAVGRTLVRDLVAGQDTCGAPAGRAALDQLAARLAAAAPVMPYTMHVTVVDDTIINALAAPGGAIVVFNGLIQASASPAELAGVLAHEMQHVLLQHGTRAVLREVPLRIAVSLISGGNAVGTAAVGTAASLGALSYRRDDESAADVEGMRMLERAGVSGDGMVRFFERMLAREDDDTRGALRYFTTHPPTAERLDRLEALSHGTASGTGPLLTDTEWSALRAICQRGNP